MAIQKYPIGIQTFSDLREGGFVYVDKTEYIMPLIEGSKYYFLSRPRRFGKSLLLSTLSDIFKGNKHLFKDLWIEDKINWDEYNFPVIHLSFASMGDTTERLDEAISFELIRIAKNYNIDINATHCCFQINELISGLHRKFSKQVVVLIDECDKPICDFLDIDKHFSKRNKDILSDFYSTLKDCDQHIRFMCLASVTRFLRTPAFAFHQYNEISMDSEYGVICGFSEQEISLHFSQRIEEISRKLKISYEFCLEKVKNWYGGYCFSKSVKDKVFNPNSTLLFLQKAKFSYNLIEEKHTISTKIIKNEFDYKLNDTFLSEMTMNCFDFDNIFYSSLLLQTGYLTIKEPFRDNFYKVGLPNHEVVKSLSRIKNIYK